MEKKEIEKIKGMLKLIPNNFPVNMEDLYEIYSQEPKKNEI